MAEAGLSSPSSISRHLHDHVPSETSSKSISLSGPPPIFRNTSQSQQHTSSRIHRRRIKSESSPMDITRDLGRAELQPPVPRMSIKSEKRPATMVDNADIGMGAFSEEYDLAHEDPGILEDVHRALKIKARRDARMQSFASNLPEKGSSKTSDPSTRSSLSTGSFPALPSYATGITFPFSDSFYIGESEVDFSPSISASAGHPVPRSTDDGATLDWSGDRSVDDKSDRKWTLSIAKRKPKDKPSSNPDRPVLENQSYIYSERLARIRLHAKPLTLRKAEMTADQLRRRYGILYASLVTGPSPMSLAAVVRWHTSQESVFKTFLERSEPSAWLKHLERKPAKGNRHSWNVTALIVEEYMKSQLRQNSMQTIPEDFAITSENVRSSSSKMKFGSFPSGMTSYKSPNPSLVRRRSYEALGGNSEMEPRAEFSSSYQRPSLQSDTDSQSSIYSVPKPRSQIVSPGSSHLHIRDFARGRKSEEVSSARNSVSEGNSQPEDQVVKKGKYRRRPSNLDLQINDEGGLESGFVSRTETTSNLDSVPTAKPDSPDNLETEEPTDSSLLRQKLRSALYRRVRSSLPPSDRLLYREGIKRQRHVDDEKERQEYEIRAHLLESAIKQNYRIRQVLQRIAGEVREFDAVQSSLSGLLGVPCLNVPQEVLDVFSHDPSAVTGSTRRFKGWRAVEDIHSRIAWQRAVLQNFVHSIAGLKGKLQMPTGIFDECISGLMGSVSHLEQRRCGIFDKTDEVTDLLTRVRELHGLVKAEFNDTLAHTSQIYPEISQISALEESYRNRYQQFWDFGMVALTFILDSVTPFWRTYGKTIGVDVQDFLIIPWYRNEFTGESKWYSITRLPRRSFKHWIGLLSLPTFSFCFLIVQIRGAISFFGWSFQLLHSNNLGFWSIFLPLLVLGVVIQWAAVLVEFCIILAEIGVGVWWIGWTVGLFT